MKPEAFIAAFSQMTPDERYRFTTQVEEIDETKERLEDALGELRAKSPEEIKSLESSQQEAWQDYKKRRSEIDDAVYPNHDPEAAEEERRMDLGINDDELAQDLEGTPLEAEWIEQELERKEDALVSFLMATKAFNK